MPAIKQQIFHENSVQLILDEGKPLRLSYDSYTEISPTIEEELSEDTFAKIFRASEKFRCREYSFRYLSIRNRSSFEMKVYLRKKKFDRELINEILADLKENGYIDDEGFAELYITDKMKTGRHGKNLIVKGLFEKGVSREIIDRKMKELGAERANMDELMVLAEKKFRDVRGKREPLVKVGNYLRGRGFGYDEIRVVLKELGEREDFSREE